MDGCDIVVGAAAIIALRETIRVAALNLITVIIVVALGLIIAVGRRRR